PQYCRGNRRHSCRIANRRMPMAIALTLQEYLNEQSVSYEVMTHELTNSSTRTAQASHVPADRLAKGVVLAKEGGFVLAVLPASCKVRLDAIEQMLHCRVSLASEDEISSIFPDCELGAIPPIGAAYALDCVVDESLEQQTDVYLEGGDHRSLIHINHAQFHELMKDMPHGRIAQRDCPVIGLSPSRDCRNRLLAAHAGCAGPAQADCIASQPQSARQFTASQRGIVVQRRRANPQPRFARERRRASPRPAQRTGFPGPSGAAPSTVASINDPRRRLAKTCRHYCQASLKYRSTGGT